MSTKTAALITSRDKKGIALAGLFDATLNKGRFDEDEAQRIFEHGGEVQAEWLATMRKFAVPNQFANEEVASNYGYPKGFVVKPIGEQVDRLAQLFKLSLGGTIEFIEKVLPGLELPEGADGWFAVPAVDAVAKRFFPEVKDPAERYCRATQLMLEMLGQSRKLYNYRDGQFGPDRLRQHSRTVSMLGQISEQQTGDILVLPGQLGLRHRGRSVRRAREVFKASEFGGGAFATGCVLLTHPGRLGTGNELFMDCAGDEYSDADGQFGLAPCFDHFGGKVLFVTFWVGHCGQLCGSVSFFLPQ